MLLPWALFCLSKEKPRSRSTITWASKGRTKRNYSCYGLNCVSSNSHEVLDPVPQNMTVFGDKAFREAIKLKWVNFPWQGVCVGGGGQEGRGGGYNPVWFESLSEEIRTHWETPGTCTCKSVLHREETSLETTARRWLSSKQRERPQGRLTLLTLWSWTSSLWKCEKKLCKLPRGCSVANSVWLFTTPWTAACQASLPFTVSRKPPIPWYFAIAELAN